MEKSRRTVMRKIFSQRRQPRAMMFGATAGYAQNATTDE
jgi:hypothetical protein